MENFNELCFRKFTKNDVECFTEIMRKAFDKDTQIHLGEKEGGPDGYENGNFGGDAQSMTSLKRSQNLYKKKPWKMPSND